PFGKHDQREPRAQSVFRNIWSRWGVTPGKVLVVELDEWEVVRLEVGDPVAGLGPHHRPVVHAHDVAGTIEFDVAVERSTGGAAIDALAGELELDRDGGAHLYRRVAICGADVVRHTQSQPGQKRVRIQLAHAASSNDGMTWSPPDKVGSLRSACCMKSDASTWVWNRAVSFMAWLVSVLATTKLSPTTLNGSSSGSRSLRCLWDSSDLVTAAPLRK